MANLEAQILTALQSRVGQHRKQPTLKDAQTIAERARAKAGHRNNKEHLVTALRREIRLWEAQ